MSDTPAGWYPDGHGGTRWWDGTAWTDNFTQSPPPPSSSLPNEPTHASAIYAPPAAETPIQRRPWFIVTTGVIGVFLLGLAGAALASSTGVDSSSNTASANSPESFAPIDTPTANDYGYTPADPYSPEPAPYTPPPTPWHPRGYELFSSVLAFKWVPSGQVSCGAFSNGCFQIRVKTKRACSGIYAEVTTYKGNTAVGFTNDVSGGLPAGGKALLTLEISDPGAVTGQLTTLTCE